MKKILKKLIALIIISNLSFFIFQKAVVLDQKIKYSEDYLQPIQKMERETQLKYLNERITHLQLVKEIKKKIYIDEISLIAESTKNEPGKQIIAELNKELSILNSNLNTINFAYKKKLNEILMVGSKGSIGMGLIYRTRQWF